MKKRYLLVAILAMVLGIVYPKAYSVGDCKVLVSFKLSSSLDEDSYICKGTKYGEAGDAIYYSGTGNTISLNNFEAYYFTNWDEKIVLDIKGNNNISLLHVSDTAIEVTGTGSLKFKQNSFAKKVENGEAIYSFFYNSKVILNEDKKVYEGTVSDFEENYEVLAQVNKLPEEYNIDNYELVQAEDYTKMSSVAITDLWFTNKISTKLSVAVEDGFGIIKYKKPEEVKVDKDENVLQTDNVVLITEKKVNKKYKLKEENLKSTPVAQHLSETLDEGKDLVSLYDVSVYDGSKIVEMKNGKYTIKIKIDEDVTNYDNYQIIYVNESGEIEEYIDGKVEDGYVVFETSHLSQYGIIADVTTTAKVQVNNEKTSLIGTLLKISFLLGIAAVSSAMVLFLNFKSKHIKRKTIKRA